MNQLTIAAQRIKDTISAQDVGVAMGLEIRHGRCRCPLHGGGDFNCVLYKDYPAEGLVPYLERFHKIPGASVQFRFDYTATTPENLYDQENDKILADLKKISRYTGLDGCRMRCGFHFDYKGMELTYHKTLPYSTIIEKDPQDGVTYAILYDILIKQTGCIHSDWDGTVMDVDRLVFVEETYFYADTPSKMGKLIYEIGYYFYMKVPTDFRPVCESSTADDQKEHLRWVGAEDALQMFPDFFTLLPRCSPGSVRFFSHDQR